MKITLPTIKRNYNENTKQIDVVRGEIEVDIDTSFQAHLKWEEQFGNTMNCDLATYTERVKSWLEDTGKSKANFLGLLKLLYCYVSSPELPTFKEFCRLFDYAVADEILTKIKDVLGEVGRTLSKN